MKKLLLVLVATLGVSLSAMAQDIIVLKNAEEVVAKFKKYEHLLKAFEENEQGEQ